MNTTKRKTRDELYVKEIVANGWDASGVRNLFETNERCCEHLGTNVVLKITEIASDQGNRSMAAEYYREHDKEVFYLDLAHPRNNFGRVYRFLDWFMIHEHAHAWQGRLMDEDTFGMLSNVYSINVDERKVKALLGFNEPKHSRLTEMGLNITIPSMPPFYLTDGEQKSIKGIEYEVARSARDIHSDVVALEIGPRLITPFGREQKYGLTNTGKMLLEFMYELINNLPQNIEHMYRGKIGYQQAPFFARQRAICEILKNSLVDADTSEMNTLFERNKRDEADIGLPLKLKDAEGHTIDEKVKWLTDQFDAQIHAKGDQQLSKAYTMLSAKYVDHMRYCQSDITAFRELDWSKAFSGEQTHGLTGALNDKNDPLMRASTIRFLSTPIRHVYKETTVYTDFPSEDERGVNLLIYKLEDPSPVVQIESIRALSNVMEERSLDPLLKLAENLTADLDVRALALHLVGRIVDSYLPEVIDQKVIFERIKPMTTEGNQKIETEAFFAISCVRSREASQYLLDSNPRDMDVDTGILRHKAEKRDKSIIPRLLELSHSGNPDLRVESIFLLGFISNPLDEEVVSRLVEGLNDNDSKVRCDSAFALDHMMVAEAIPALTERLCVEKDPRVVLFIVDALASFREIRTKDVLRGTLRRDLHPRVNEQVHDLLNDQEEWYSQDNSGFRENLIKKFSLNKSTAWMIGDIEFIKELRYGRIRERHY